MATVAVPSTHAPDELRRADVVLGSLDELPAVLATRFDATEVLKPQD
jgi:hypothetical protein